MYIVHAVTSVLLTAHSSLSFKVLLTPAGLKAAGTYESLFRWHQHNASILLSDDVLKRNFVEVLSQFSDIELHENYAGAGTAGRSLHQQLSAFKTYLKEEAEETEIENSGGFQRMDCDDDETTTLDLLNKIVDDDDDDDDLIC